MRRVLFFFSVCLIAGGMIFVRDQHSVRRSNRPQISHASKPEPKHEKRSASDLFSSGEIPRLRIEIPRGAFRTLENTHWRNGEERPEVKVTVKEGNTIYENVGLHLKGAAGSFRSIDDKPALTLNFQKFSPGQSFHGLHKLSLNNSVQDPSYLSEKICRELFAAAGVPVPRSGHARVSLNGRDLGLFVLTEGFNKQFLKKHFKDTTGVLYDSGFVQDITGSLIVNSGDKSSDRSGLEPLVSACRESDPSKRWEKLERALDMDRFLSFIAMEVIQCHWDGYAMNHNNWRVYHDVAAEKYIFMPHGLDQMFGVMRSSPNCPILPRMQGWVARAVVSTPEGKRRYLEKVGDLSANVFKVDLLLKRVDEISATIRPVLAESDPNEARSHDVHASMLKSRIAARAESLKTQLANPDKRDMSEEENGFPPVQFRRMRPRR